MPKGVMWPHRAFFFACLNGVGYYHPDGPCKVPSDIASRASEGYALSLFCTAPPQWKGSRSSATASATRPAAAA